MLDTLAAKPKLTPSSTALVAANGIPVIGMFFFGWELSPLVFVYWTENAVVGVFTVEHAVQTTPGGVPDG